MTRLSRSRGLVLKSSIDCDMSPRAELKEHHAGEPREGANMGSNMLRLVNGLHQPPIPRATRSARKW
eukprot:11920421-Alexandrium_andersonii.AAC.1